MKKNLPKVVPFNRKNVKKLADTIFSDNNGIINCLKLCAGKLSNGKDDGRTLHCGIGEAYFNFVSSNMGKHNFDAQTTGRAINALVKVAKLKNASGKNRMKLIDALEVIVLSNDEDYSNNSHEPSLFMARSMRVAEMFRQKVAPLLK